MNQRFKTYINYGILGCLLVMGISGVGLGVHRYIQYEREVPDVFMVIEQKDKKSEYKEKDFPRTISFVFSMEENIEIIGEDIDMVYGRTDKEWDDYSFYLIEDEGKNKTFLTGDKAGYSYQEDKLFDVSEPFSFDEKNGTVDIEFKNLQQYLSFLDDMTNGENFRDVIIYLKEQKKEN